MFNAIRPTEWVATRQYGKIDMRILRQAWFRLQICTLKAVLLRDLLKAIQRV